MTFADPNPYSRRFPFSWWSKTHDRAPPVLMTRYNPSPSACRPGVFNAFTAMTVSFLISASVPTLDPTRRSGRRRTGKVGDAKLPGKNLSFPRVL